MNDTQAQLERLRRLDVDVDELLDAAARLAEIRREVRTKAAEPTLPPGHPDNLSRVLVVPAVEEEDVDPVALLWSSFGMATLDQRPALALHVAAAAPVGSGGPLASVRTAPKSLFSPEVAQHVSRLIDFARRPGRPHWIEGEAGPPPLFDARFLPLPAHLIADADEIAQLFLEEFRDPLLVYNDILVGRLAELDAQAPPMDPEDVPIGQAIPPAQADFAARRAARQAEGLAVADEAVLVTRHAAQRAVEKLLQAAGQRPSDALHPFTLNYVAQALDTLPKGERVQLLADCLDVHPKTVIRALSVWKKKYRVRPRRRGHSSAVQCPQKAPKTTSTISTPGTPRTGRKQATHDEDQRPKPTQTRRPPARLPQDRPATPDRNQRERLEQPDRHRPSQSPPHRKDRPRQPG